MTSLLRSDAACAIRLTLFVLMAVSCYGASADSAQEGAQTVDEAPLADAENDSAQDSPSGPDAPARKPWLITPTLSADPKLGANVGALVAYVKKLDADSTPSMLGLSVSYSDTDSSTGALFGQLYWGQDTRRMTLLLASAEVNNEYDDFLNQGTAVKTQDSVQSFAARYMQQFRTGGWFAGVQGVSTNYAVGADDSLQGVIDQIGLSGFDATGLGLILQHDTMDNQRDPGAGHLFTLHNIAYRKTFGGESSFDVGLLDLSWYHSLGRAWSTRTARAPVIAVQMTARVTDDAPPSGFSSVTLPSYTRGNYLSQHYSHLLIDGRFPITKKFGLVAFGGVGCQFGVDILNRDVSCDDALFPAVGAGVSYMLKEEASLLIRLEFAKGKSDNEAVYLRFGHSF
jgi:hypothetical protein